jgi:SAM-dependent methyltransferase
MSKNSSRDWLDIELRAFAASLPDGALVLDAGSGDLRYAPVFARQRYESADFEKVDKVYRPPTYSCDLIAVPVEDGRFDAVISTQVLEHLPDPLAVLNETRRILKPGGRLFLSAPLWYEEHEKPYDFYRYTRFGLAHLLGRAGFVVDDLRPLEGLMGSVQHQLRLMRKLPARPAAYGGGVVGLAYAAIFQLFRIPLYLLRPLANAADRRHRHLDNDLPANYVAIAHRAA